MHVTYTFLISCLYNYIKQEDVPQNMQLMSNKLLDNRYNLVMSDDGLYQCIVMVKLTLKCPRKLSPTNMPITLLQLHIVVEIQSGPKVGIQ